MAQREVTRSALGRLQALTARATDTLAALLDAQSESVRVTAAREILARGTDAAMVQVLEERVGRLERGRV
jgi:hypothetical protein